MSMPRSLANDLERVRSECESQLCQLDIVDSVVWRERDPEVFPVGHGYVALIPCEVAGMQSLPEVSDQPVEVGLGVFAVAIKHAGADERWTGFKLLYPDEGNMEKTKLDVSAQLEEIM